MEDDPIVAREFGNLVEFPNVAIAGSLAEKDERFSLTVDLVIEFYVL